MMRTTVNTFATSDWTDQHLLTEYAYLQLLWHTGPMEDINRAYLAAVEYEILRRMSQSNVSEKESVDTT